MTYEKIPVSFIKLPHGEGVPLPSYGTLESAGADLVAALEAPVILNPGERGLIPTGLMIALPQGYEGQIRSRSGLAFRHGVVVLNSPGTIDPDYRGEVKVILINHGSEAFTIERGMKVAQLVLAPVIQGAWELKTAFTEETARGAGGFGSTGYYAADPSLPKIHVG